MKIGFAGPVSVELLGDLVGDGGSVPVCHGFPMMAYLVREYVEHGHDVSVFALSDCTEAELTIRGTKVTLHVAPARRRRAWVDLFAAERGHLLKAMRADPCDVIHAQWTYEFASAAIASGVPHVVTAQDAMLNILKYMSPRSLPHWLAKAALSSLVVKQTRAMTAVSGYLREYYLKHGYKHAIAVVPNGVVDGELDKYRQHEDRDGNLVFASVLNGWGARKNGASALRAFARYRRAHPGARLEMFGDEHGEDGPAAAWARKNALAEGVNFVGPTAHSGVMTRLQTDVDVLLHPAREEAFGVAVIEAMSAGVPVIAGAGAGGVAEIVGGGGVLVDDVSDTRQLVGAMEELSGAEVRRAYGERGLAQVKARHCLSMVAGEYLGRLAEAAGLPWPAGRTG